jgi:phosphoribosylanthranilate isomerase
MRLPPRTPALMHWSDLRRRKSAQGVKRGRAQTRQALPAFVTPVALFVDPQPAEVERVLDEVGRSCCSFKATRPRFLRAIWRALHQSGRVRPGMDLLQYASRHRAAKGLLLDAFVEGSHGGTGSTFDWSLIPAKLPLPLILAGGLDPDNVGDAVRRVRPWAVDVSSGVETGKGIKDAAKIAAFIRGVRDADV